MNDFEDIEEIGELLDIEAAIDEELGAIGDVGAASPRGKRKQVLMARRNKIQTRLRLIGAQIGGINPRRLRGLIPTIRPLYAHYRIAASTLTSGTDYTFFSKGIGDAASNLGWASGNLTSRHTNMGQEGKLPNKELFFVYGVGFGLLMLPTGGAGNNLRPNQVDPDDLFHFGNMSFRYEEGQGTRTTLLGNVADAPVQQHQVLQLAGTAGSVTRDAVRQAGAMYRRKKPMFVIQGGDQNEQNRIVARCHESVSALRAIDATNTAQFSAYLYGIWWQHPTKNVSA